VAIVGRFAHPQGKIHVDCHNAVSTSASVGDVDASSCFGKREGCCKLCGRSVGDDVVGR